MSQDRAQELINLERCKELYPNGLGSSGMAAIGNSVWMGSTKHQRWELERPKQDKE